MRVTLIHNPAAGAQGAGDAALLQRVLREAGHRVRYQSCKDDGWKKALKKRADLVAVAGGDGTVAKVARRMAGRGVPLATLPLGTANNISRTIGVIDRPIEMLVEGWPKARRIRLDIGLASGPWGERRFVEGVGAGLFASVLARPKGKPKRKAMKADARVVKGLARLRKLARSCRAMEIEATLDGKDISGRYLLFEAMSIPYIGPSLFLAPEAHPGDGTFDVVLVGEAERERLLAYLESWQENRERIAVLPSHRGRHLTVEWSGFDLHVDDKLRPKRGKKKPKAPARIDVRLDGVSVEVLCPAEKPAD